MHRVKNSPSKHRISAPFFFQPRLDCEIRPINDDMSAESGTNLPLNKPFAFGEYVLNKFQKSYGISKGISWEAPLGSMKEPSKIGKHCQKRFLVINFLSIEKTSKMTMQNDIFLLSPIDNLDDGCWSTFTFSCAFIGYNNLTFPKKALIFLSNAWGVLSCLTIFFLLKRVSWQISLWTLFILLRPR